MKKKVLFLIQSLKFGGGAPKVTSSLTLELAKKYDVSTLSLFHFQKNYPFLGKYYSIKAKHRFSGVLFRIFKIYKIIKSISPDIIITFMTLTSFWVIPIKFLFRIDIPLVISINTNPNKQYKKRIYFKYLIRLLFPLKIVNALVPVSKELKQILHNDYKIDKTKIIPIYNGIDIEKIRQIAKENIDDYKDVFNNEDIFKFITVGRLSGEKGHKYLIEAFSKVIKETPNSRLFIIGEGPLRGQLTKLIKDKKLENKVVLLGTKNNPYKYIAKANIFVLSSLHEGLPFSLIEALTCGIPIISTNCETGPKEILENGKYGLLTNVADSNDLAEKMILLAKNEELRENFSKKSIDRIKIFENGIFIDNWINLIEDYLHKK